MAYKHSKLQLTVLSLYKAFLRIAKDRPPELQNHIKRGFREGAKKYKKSDVFMIEYELRKASRQLNLLQSASITGFQSFRVENKSAKLNINGKPQIPNSSHQSKL